MAIITLDSVSVSVDTFADLRTVLADYSTYAAITTVYLAADITIASSGISINPNRTTITLDGQDPNDSTGATIHTITDCNSAASADTIGVRSTPAGNMNITFQNINWIGYDYYGIFYTPDAAAYNVVSITFNYIHYTGPQMTYHAYGLTRFIDCTVKTIQAYSSLNEVAEVSRVEIGGTTTIQQTSTAYPIFYFRDGNSNSFSLKILPDANVTLIAGNDVVQGNGYYTALEIGENATLTATTQSSFCRDTSGRLSSVLVGEGASFIINQQGGANHTIYCNGSFTVNRNASVSIISSYSGAGYLIYFYPTASVTAGLILVSPSSFILYKANANLLYFGTTTVISIAAQQVNYWTTAAASATAGTLSDIPTYSWRKTDGTDVLLTGTATVGANSITGNFTAEEELLLPALSNLKLWLTHAFSAGNLPLSVDVITSDGYPVTGTTLPGANLLVDYTAGATTGIADNMGAFSVTTPVLDESTPVTVKSNVPFLITSFTRNAVDPGELLLQDIPDTLPFVLSAIASEPVVLYGRQDSGWMIAVEDSRVRSEKWYLYAATDGPLTSTVNPEHTVPGALVFINADNVIVQLGAEPILVYTGDGNGGSTKTTNVSWDGVKGILLQAVNAPYYNGEEYRAQIAWTLTETMTEDVISRIEE